MASETKVQAQTTYYPPPASSVPYLGAPVGIPVASNAPVAGVVQGSAPPHSAVPPHYPTQCAAGVGTVPVALPAGAPNRPVFLGATQGHGPTVFTCPACGYQGLSKIKKVSGWGQGMFLMLTFGIGALVGGLKDTHHYCQQCDNHLAYAKVM